MCTIGSHWKTNESTKSLFRVCPCILSTHACIRSPYPANHSRCRNHRLALQVSQLIDLVVLGPREYQPANSRWCPEIGPRNRDHCQQRDERRWAAGADICMCVCEIFCMRARVSCLNFMNAHVSKRLACTTQYSVKHFRWVFAGPKRAYTNMFLCRLACFSCVSLGIYRSACAKQVDEIFEFPEIPSCIWRRCAFVQPKCWSLHTSPYNMPDQKSETCSLVRIALAHTRVRSKGFSFKRLACHTHDRGTIPKQFATWTCVTNMYPYSHKERRNYDEVQAVLLQNSQEVWWLIDISRVVQNRPSSEVDGSRTVGC